jgi:hypothetical protein
MTQNKFWLVLTEKQAQEQEKFLTKEYAIQEAKELAKNGDRPYYVLEATHSFQADINVIETKKVKNDTE